MVTTCISCGRLIPRGRGRCRSHGPQGRRVRSTYAWRVLSQRVRSRGSCARCGASGVPLEADHIVPVSERPDLALDIGNVEPLCRPCHRDKGRA